MPSAANPIAYVWFALSLLTFFPAPAKVLWYVQLGVTEWSLGALLVGFLFWILLGRFFSWRGHVVMLAAQLALFSPMARAYQRAQTLPDDLARAFPHAKAPDRLPFTWIPKKPLIHLDPLKTLSFSSGDQPLSVDYTRPAVETDLLPLILIVHSGSWQSGERGELLDFRNYLASLGYAVASTDYRFAPAHPFPAGRDDVLAALACLRLHWKELRFDPAKVVLLGRSAGGQLAVSAAYSLHDPGIKGVVSFYAPLDLVWAYSKPSNPLIMDSKKVIEDYIGWTPEQNPALYRDASPVYHVDATTPPTLLVHGDLDSLVWPQHSEKMNALLAEAGRPHFYLELPWATHACEVNPYGPSGQLMTYTLEYFLREVL